MDTLAHLANGFAVALAPINLMWALVGVTVGTAIGVLPGLGPALTIALLLPLTYKVSATSALILFAGIYYGAMYGGSTTSILLNTPGESATIVTALEGNKMARKGRAGAALATAAIGSFVAGTLGTIGITFLAEPVVRFALRFGPAEYFSLMVLAFVTVSAVLGTSAHPRPDRPRARHLPRPDRHRPADRPAALHLRPHRAAGRHQRDRRRRRPVRGRRDALSRRLQEARRRRRDHRREGLDLDEPRGLGPLLEAVAARRRHRLPDRRHAGRRRRDPDISVLLDRKAPHQKTRGVRPRRHRGRGRSRGRQQRLRRRRAGADAGPRPADLGDGCHHALRLPELRHQPRPAPPATSIPSWCGA